MESFNWLHVSYSVTIIASIMIEINGSRANRVLRRAGDQPFFGNCQSYKWGGSSGLHWYVCCNNCRRGSSYIPSCDAYTYQSASSSSYCDACGTDKHAGNGEKFKTEFSCGDCTGQENYRNKCKSGWRFFTRIPGFCWAFVRCFEDKCRSHYGTAVNTKPDSCYDLRCDSEESIDNCPSDCCYKKNPTDCTWEDGVCLKECCGESTCCLSSKANMYTTDYAIFLILIPTFIFPYI